MVNTTYRRYVSLLTGVMQTMLSKKKRCARVQTTFVTVRGITLTANAESGRCRERWKCRRYAHLQLHDRLGLCAHFRLFIVYSQLNIPSTHGPELMSDVDLILVWKISASAWCHDTAGVTGEQIRSEMSYIDTGPPSRRPLSMSLRIAAADALAVFRF